MSADSQAPIGIDSVRAAADAIRHAIAEADGPLPPSYLIDFLLRDWRRHLAWTHHRHGSESREWRQAVDITQRLLVSVLPIDSAETRSKLLKTLPTLIGDLRAGMAAVAVPEAERDAFLSELRETHMALINAPLPTAPPVEPDFTSTVAMNVMDPRYRELLDKLDGASVESVEHIDM